jgi:NAD(P)-dependent dehydrogenase (short-subunit alcohol dehydrogenase family)
MLDINLRTAYNLSRAAVKPMIAQRWGRIVNFGSVPAWPAKQRLRDEQSRVLRLPVMAAEGITVSPLTPSSRHDEQANRKARRTPISMGSSPPKSRHPLLAMRAAAVMGGIRYLEERKISLIFRTLIY